ncbi:MAG: putative amidoligase domain-containing protein [bacterium]|jgi:hypothetical protein
MQLKLGCDPEVFMVDLQGNLRSAIGRIGGTKTSPQPLPLGDGYAVQEDNVAMEFNIPPASNAKEYVEYIGKTLSFLKEGIQSMYQYDISKLSAASWPEEELQTPQAQMFGCDPDFNAWTGDKNPRPKAEDTNLRSCGGHVHVGFDKSIVDTKALIKCMDLYHGVPSVLMDEGELRKQLYGKRGAYREKPFGAEYRVLSNFWIFNPATIEWVWRNAERAVAAVEAQFPINELDDQILQAIDNNDKAMAEQLVKDFKLEVVHV